ncbi:MAG: hypothetical protein ACK5PQ_02465 [Alphaproteobacteria bacterium]
MMKRCMMMGVFLAHCSGWAGGMAVEDSGFESCSPVKIQMYEDENPWQEVKQRKKKPSARKKKKMKASPSDKKQGRSLDRDSRLGPPISTPGEAGWGSDPSGRATQMVMEENIRICNPKVDLRRDWLIPLKMRRHIAGTIIPFLNEAYEGPFPLKSQEEIQDQADFIGEAKKDINNRLAHQVGFSFRMTDDHSMMWLELQKKINRGFDCYEELERLESWMRTKIDVPHLRIQYKGFEDFYGLADKTV